MLLSIAWSVAAAAAPAPTNPGSQGIPLDSWPAPWFGAPRAASSCGIDTFREAPSLASRVARGELPPLRQRLPRDPYVIEPAEGIGQYGGTLRVFEDDEGLVTGLEMPLTIDPGRRKIDVYLEVNGFSRYSLGGSAP